MTTQNQERNEARPRQRTNTDEDGHNHHRTTCDDPRSIRMTTQPTTTDRPPWLSESAYPFIPRNLSLPSGEISYVDEGEGPILLFVHAGMWSFVFRDVIDRLRDDFRCITLDFPGFGLAPDAPEPVPTLSRFATVLGEFTSSLDLNDLTLVAHDLGGPVALGFAAEHPEQVTGLVLTNTFAWEPDRRTLRAMLGIMGSRTFTTIDTATNLVPTLTATRFGIGRRLDRTSKAAFLGPFADRNRRRRFHELMRSALDSTDLFSRVEEGTVTTLNDRPVLTIFGERNDPWGFQARHAALFPDHEAVVVAKGYHFPMADDSGLFADSIREWWHRKVSAGTDET